MNESELFGRTLRVNLAKPMKIGKDSMRPIWATDEWLQVTDILVFVLYFSISRHCLVYGCHILKRKNAKEEVRALFFFLYDYFLVLILSILYLFFQTDFNAGLY